MFLPSPVSGEYEQVPAGTYVATCYRFIDRGTQTKNFMGQEKRRHEIMLSFELDELMTDGRPYTINKIYSWSMHPMYSLRKDLETWRGKPFAHSDFSAFNTRSLLGLPATITITHDLSKDGERTFARLSSIGKPMKGMPTPALINPMVYLALTPGDWDKAAYEGLSDRMREIIALSPEYAALTGKKPPEEEAEKEFDDECPF